MQYKGTEVSEKAMLKINADGGVVSCAKGDMEGCGYKAGNKVCGKCGAMAMQVKEDMDEEISEEEMELAKLKKRRAMGADMPDMDEDDEEMPEEKGMGFVGMGALPDDEDDEEKGGMGQAVPALTPEEDRPVLDDEDEEMKEMMADEEDDNYLSGMIARRRAARMKRLRSMGMKSAEITDDAYLCAVERKVLPGVATPCASCPGGCAPESNLPTLLEVEGMAEEMFGGKVLDSGYGASVDVFLVDMRRKDGRIIEARFDGTTGECTGWDLLNDTIISEKSAEDSPLKIIGSLDAAEIAVKSVEGTVKHVDADEFDGYDAWAVEIEGVDGKSYDVYVALDGEVLGYDEYTVEEAADIEAEAAEIALKSAYGDDDRDRMAEEGLALPDGSYPIADEDDLRNAIKAYGRAGDKGAARRHIKKRARDLDAEDLLPENWEKTDDADVETKADETVDAELLASLMEFEMLALESDLD
jgi:uncharacterized membrane protein YkoI